MKKNLLTVLILALLVVNIGLTAVMMISVTSTNNKTAALVNTIATVMNLELVGTTGTSDETPQVSLADTVIYSVSGSMTIPLKMSDGDTKQTYMVCDVSLSMNSKHDDYESLGAGVAEGKYESVIKDTIRSVVSGHTQDEITENTEGLKAEILRALQTQFGSDFIYGISFSECKFG